jgi:phage shock protein C
MGTGFLPGVSKLAKKSETEGVSGRRLTRSRRNRVLGGVCGGIGEYFGVDPVLVRLVFILAVFSGFGFPIYLLLWLVIPLEGNENSLPRENVKTAVDEMKARAKSLKTQVERDSERDTGTGGTRVFLGIGLVLLGVFLLLRELGIFSFLNSTFLLAVFLVFLGLVLLLRWEARKK